MTRNKLNKYVLFPAFALFAVILTLVIMVLAVFVLAFIPASWSLFVPKIGAVAFAVCIVSYWPVIRGLVK